MAWFEKRNNEEDGLENKVSDTIIDIDNNVIPIIQFYECPITGINIAQARTSLYVMTNSGYIAMEKRE